MTNSGGDELSGQRRDQGVLALSTRRKENSARFFVHSCTVHPSPHHTATIVLVEGLTDELALTLAARRLGRDLEAEGVSILPMSGAHAISRFLPRLAAEEPRANLAGLYDEGEEGVVRAALERAGNGPNLDRSGLERVGFFACSVDLEDELVRAAGEAILLRLIELEGDSKPWHTFQKQEAWKDRQVDQQFRRFIRSVSERNSRYIRSIVETIDPSQLPRPVRLLLDHVEPRRVPPG